MKQTLLILTLFFILTFPSYKGLLTTHMISNDDLSSHVIRLIEFDNALKDGHFPVRWSKRVNFGLGYPFLVFNYPLVYYLAEGVHKLGFNFPDSMKLLMLLSFPLSGFFAYLWLKQHFKVLPAFIGGLTYTLIPYHFINVYIRGAMGEILAITAVPLGFYFLDRLCKNPNPLNVFTASLSFAAVIMFHNVIALYFIPIFCIYFFIQFQLNKSRKLFLAFLCCLVWSLALSAFYLIPAYLYKPLVALDGLKHDFLGHAVFPLLKNLIYSKWGFGGPNQNFGQGEMPLQLGVPHQASFIAAFILLTFKVRREKTHHDLLGWFWVIIFILSVFMMLKVSFPIWETIPILQYQEFPWRILGIVSAPSAFFSAYLFSSIQKKFPLTTSLLLGILIILSLVYIHRNYGRPERYYPWEDPFKRSNIIHGTETYTGEHLPLWHSTSEEITPYIPVKVVSGDAKITHHSWRTNYHSFDLEVGHDSIIADRTDYFPGWEVYANGERLKTLDPGSQEANGLIAFPLKPGKYSVEVKLKETLEEKIANSITLLALILVPIILILKVKKGRRARNQAYTY